MAHGTQESMKRNKSIDNTLSNLIGWYITGSDAF